MRPSVVLAIVVFITIAGTGSIRAQQGPGAEPNGHWAWKSRQWGNSQIWEKLWVANDSAEDTQRPIGRSLVPLQNVGGTFVVPAVVNNVIHLPFVVDSGATDVSIPEHVVGELFQSGTLNSADFVGQKTYKLADGSTIPSRTFWLRSVKVGNKIVENVLAGMAPTRGSLLLGQSFLSRFKSWSLDNVRHVLVLD